MNKRQRKKYKTKVCKRAKYFCGINFIAGRKNGKTLALQRLLKAMLSKKYRPFKDMQKCMDRLVNK